MNRKTVKRWHRKNGSCQATSSGDLAQWKLLNPHKNISHLKTIYPLIFTSSVINGQFTLLALIFARLQHSTTDNLRKIYQLLLVNRTVISIIRIHILILHQQRNGFFISSTRLLIWLSRISRIYFHVRWGKWSVFQGPIQRNLEDHL